MTRSVAIARWVLLGGLLAFCGSVPPAADPPKKDEPKKDAPKKVVPDDFPFPPLPDVQFPPGFDPQEFQRFQEEMKKVSEELRKQFGDMQQTPGRSPTPPLLVPPGFTGIERKPRDNRLGAVVQTPSPALVDQ